MPTLRLPDGTLTELPEGEPVGSALPPGSIAARVDGELRDLSYVPGGDVAAEAIDVRTDDGLHVLRHSTAHVLAQAVSKLWPGTRLGIGPTITDGFYYDLAIPEHVSADDLPRIEEAMRAIVAEDQPFIREDNPSNKRSSKASTATRPQATSRPARRPRASTATTGGRICVSGRTFRRPGGSARSS